MAFSIPRFDGDDPAIGARDETVGGDPNPRPPTCPLRSRQAKTRTYRPSAQRRLAPSNGYRIFMKYRRKEATDKVEGRPGGLIPIAMFFSSASADRPDPNTINAAVAVVGQIFLWNPF